MRSRSGRGKTANTDAPLSQNDEETKDGPLLEVKLTRNSIKSHRASIDQKTSNMADADYIVHKKPVKMKNQTHLDNPPSDECKKHMTRSQPNQKDLYSDGDDENDDDDDQESKQKPWVSPSKTSSIDDNEDDGELEQKLLILQKGMDCKKAGMGNQKNNKNLFSDDDEAFDRKRSPTSKTSSSDHKKPVKRNQTNRKDSYSEDHKKPVKRNQTNRKDSYSEGTSWCSNKIKTIFSVFITLVIAASLSAYYGLYGAFWISEHNNVLRHFHDHFNALKSSYDSQPEDLWRRTRRSLELHLNKSESNTQPVIILLTAARDAERTLQCISSQLARVYSASRNNSYMVISGANQTFHNGDSAKQAIDDILTSGFQNTSAAAVLQHIELLHPGALLILYKYCDHENAAFKNVALVLTVLLEDSKLERQLSLKEIEEKVRDFLKVKMISPKSTESHSEMDADKLSGVWSRISHTVLPVYPEDTNGDCG